MTGPRIAKFIAVRASTSTRRRPLRRASAASMRSITVRAMFIGSRSSYPNDARFERGTAQSAPQPQQRRPDHRRPHQEALPALHPRDLGFEPGGLTIENGALRRSGRQLRLRFRKDAEDASQHAGVARREAVGTARIPAERLGMAREGEASQR